MKHTHPLIIQEKQIFKNSNYNKNYVAFFTEQVLTGNNQGCQELCRVDGWFQVQPLFFF